MDEVMLHGGLLVAKMLKQEGVEVVFTLSGGHIAAIYDGCVREGIRVMDTRHEQVAVHAAEGWAKVTRTPGVALLTAGPGVTDGITGIANAYLAGSPVLVFGGAAPVAHWDQGALQELRHVELVRPITKWARTVVQTNRLAEYTAMAFREATAERPGPVFLECPMDVLNGFAQTADCRIPSPGYRTDGPSPGRPGAASSGRRRCWRRRSAPSSSRGRPSGGMTPPSRCASWPSSFKRPSSSMAAGGAACRRIIRSSSRYARRAALSNADLLLVVGTKLDFRLNYGQPPLIPADGQIIWLDRLESEIGVNRERRCRHRGQCRRDAWTTQRGARQIRRHQDPGWRRCARQEEKARAAEEALMASDATPIHPLRLCRELRDALDHDAYVIGDGGDIVSYGARVINAWEPGHWLDAGPMGTLGAGTGFAIATKIARPDKQVAVLFGDGAFGLNGMEFETMARHNLPVVAVIGNDGQWAQIKHPQKAMLGHSTAADLAPGTRYDRMVEALGGYGELVTEPAQIRPAIERAFASGKPACVNVLTDPTVVYGRSTQAAV